MMNIVTKTIFLILPLSTMLINSVNLSAQDGKERRDDRRDYRHHVYDQSHKDYHDFGVDDDRAWHIYLERHRVAYVDWDVAAEEQRQAFWNWRHDNSNALLNINIR